MDSLIPGQQDANHHDSYKVARGPVWTWLWLKGFIADGMTKWFVHVLLDTKSRSRWSIYCGVTPLTGERGHARESLC